MLRLVKSFNLPPSYTDTHADLSICGIFTMLQDIAGEHAEQMGVGFHTFEEKSGALWIIARSKVKIINAPKMYTPIVVETWPSKPTGLLCTRNYRITSPEGEVYATGKNDWLVIDAKTHALRRLNSTCYPMDEEYSEEIALNEPYLKAEQPEAHEHVYTHRVRYRDTDYNKHTNNVSYVSILLNALPADYFAKHRVTGLDIKYTHESKEGDEIFVYAHQFEGGCYLFGKRPTGEEIVAATLLTEKK